MKDIYVVLFLLVFCSCQRSKTEGISVSQVDLSGMESYTLVLKDSIPLEETYRRHMSIKISNENQSKSTPRNIWSHDGSGLVLTKYSKDGRVLKTMTTPTINEPYGLNRITDFFLFNNDSIFVYDGEFSRLLLINEKSEIINHWLINNYVADISPERTNEIVDIYKNSKGEINLDITGYSNYYYTSDPEFFSNNTLLYKINLSSGNVKKGITYPESGPYRKYLFWSSIIPNVRKYSDYYLAIFSHDENLYFYNSDLDTSWTYKTQPKNFPFGQGNPLRSMQEANFARIDMKINGFNYKIRSPFKTEIGDVFARVYRAPLGDHDDIPDDYENFMKGSYDSKIYLQAFNLNGPEIAPIKMFDDIEISSLKLGSLLFIDYSLNFYFLKSDPTDEGSTIYIVSLVKKE